MKKSSFGSYLNQEIDLYTLSNSNGMELSISNYGATITSIKIPGELGKDEVVCGFDTLEGYFVEEYKANAPYFGCTVGRVASIIKDSSFKWNGKKYDLTPNAGEDQLHGGVEGFDKKIWQAFPEDKSITFRLHSPDGEEGFPGNLDVEVTFELTDDNEIKISYHSTTDKTTPVSLTNHSYFNLNGFRSVIADHYFQIDSHIALETQPDNAPVGNPFNLEGHFSDFSKKKLLKDVLATEPKGVLQYYLFEITTGTLKKVAHVEVPELKRSLEVFTTEPGMLFYTGYYTSDQLKRKNGQQYGSLRAFCFETHRLPNSMNTGLDEGIFLKPGDKRFSQTVYKFSF